MLSHIHISHHIFLTMPMTMTTAIIIQATVALACLSHDASAFSASPYYSSTPRSLQLHRSHRNDGDDPRDRVEHPTTSDLFDFDDGDGALLLGGGHQARSTRRSVLRQSLCAATAAAAFPRRADAALGSLPEFRDTNAVFQSLTVDVTDQDQYARTIAFFTLGFDGMTVLRERNGGPVKETVRALSPRRCRLFLPTRERGGIGRGSRRGRRCGPWRIAASRNSRRAVFHPSTACRAAAGVVLFDVNEDRSKKRPPEIPDTRSWGCGYKVSHLTRKTRFATIEDGNLHV